MSKSSPSPRPSSDTRLLGIEKQQHMINSLSTTSGGYVCSISSDNTKHNSSPQQHQVRVVTPSHSREDSLPRLSSIPIGDDSCSKPVTTQVTARKSSHKTSTMAENSQPSFKASTHQRKLTLSTNNDVTTPITTSSATTMDPSLLVIKTKYNRRNNPDLEKRRIHFCDHPGNNNN